ncbi:MAG: IS4 family transposase [Bacteriovoracaceae bacterium]|nr:IS4 family transposase [Bacteriovoracaceae bacterium]
MGSRERCLSIFDNNSVSSDLILDPHYRITYERSLPDDRILIVQDTSKINYDSHRATEGLSSYSTSKGFETHGLITHTALAVNTDGVPLGVIDQKTWTRSIDDDVKELSEYKNYKRPIEEKESYRWIEALKKSKERMPDKDIVIVGDRENDIYEFFQEALIEDVNFVVRSSSPRTIEDTSGLHQNMDHKLRKLPEMGRVCLHIPAKQGVAARSAVLELRFTEVMLLSRPRGIKIARSDTRVDIPLNVVELVERNPPKGIKALHWRILTNLKVNNDKEALEIIHYYKQRWQIETFFKILKSTCKVEDCRLGHAEKLIKFIALKSIIAWRIYWATMLRRESSELPADCIITTAEWKSAWVTLNYKKIKEKKIPNQIPEKVPTLDTVIKWIAQLGGWLGRKGDGEPGVMSIAKGWQRIESGAMMWETMNDQCKKPTTDESCG